jgi:drug/metabolite transporter (DMT)-like permease
MLFLVLSILLSTTLFVVFRWFHLKKINLLMAIAGNYVSCILTALVLNGGLYFQDFSIDFIIICLSLGFLFFLVFFAMGFVSSNIGVGIASASSKMSLIIPVLFGTLILNESLNFVKILALFLAIISVVLISYHPKDKMALKFMLIPFFVFLGSGFIDTCLNLLQLHIQQNQLNNETAIALIFIGALVSIMVYILFFHSKLLSDKRSFSYGLLLGVPNYFSIYFLVLALGSGFLQSNHFYMINNTSVMLCSFIAALILFKEKINYRKLLGIALAVLAIYLSVK